MATVVTVDGIFENIPTNTQIISALAPKIQATTFSNNVSQSATVTTPAVGPSWRRPDRAV